MKKIIPLLSQFLLALLVLPALCVLGTAAEIKAKHPKLTDQEKYIACDQCHAEATPEVYKQWFDSRHGVAMVKCYQCHGTFETFRVTPTRQDCAACHENMMQKCPKEKPCWQCHPPHTFKAKK